MARKFTGDSLIVASHNSGKVREISDLLAQYSVTPISAGLLGLPEPVEDGLTFKANAEIKALAAATAANMPALADDSGLAVDALDGAPGIYSARWAGPNKDFSPAMERVMLEVGDSTKAAHFVCALSLAWPDGHIETFEGTVHGDLTWPMRGNNGFGYDAIFVPHGHSQSFGEMDPAEKHAMSHRADAFKQLIEACFKAG